MKGKVVLIVDDNRDAADTLGLVLGMSGFEVLLAYGGAQALEVAERERPQAAVLDIGMPGMDGYQVAERIRAAEWGSGMLLIALTGWGEDVGRATAFDHHLVKPADPDELERLLGA